MKQPLRVVIFTADIEGMSPAELYALCAIFHRRCEPKAHHHLRIFHVDPAEFDYEEFNDFVMSVFNQHAAKWIKMGLYDRCPYCLQIRTQFTDECGGYGKGSCAQFATESA